MKLTFKIKLLNDYKRFKNFPKKRFQSKSEAISFLYAEYLENNIQYKYHLWKLLKRSHVEKYFSIDYFTIDILYS